MGRQLGIHGAIGPFDLVGSQARDQLVTKLCCGFVALNRGQGGPSVGDLIVPSGATATGIGAGKAQLRFGVEFLRGLCPPIQRAGMVGTPVESFAVQIPQPHFCIGQAGCGRLFGVGLDDLVGQQDFGAQKLSIRLAVIGGDGQPFQRRIAVLLDPPPAIELTAQQIGCVSVSLLGGLLIEVVGRMGVVLAANALFEHASEYGLGRRVVGCGKLFKPAACTHGVFVDAMSEQKDRAEQPLGGRIAAFGIRLCFAARGCAVLRVVLLEGIAKARECGCVRDQ